MTLALRLFVLCSLLVPALASGGPAGKPVGAVTGVALMPLEAPAEDAASGRQILAAVRDALDTTPGFAEKGPVEMGLDEARMSFSCFDEKPGCMAQVGALVDAKFLLWGKLKRDGQTLRLELHLVDVAKGTARDEGFAETEPGAVDRLGRRASEMVVGRRKTPEVAVSIRSLPAGASVVVDGSDLGTTPLEAQLPVGQHTVELRMQGMQSRRRTFELQEGMAPLTIDERLTELEGHVGPAVPKTPQEVTEEAQPQRGPRFWAGIACAGVSAAAVASATIFGLKVLDHQDWADKHRDPSTATDAEWAQREDEMRSVRLASNISWAVAGAAAGAGAYLLLTADEGSGGSALHLVPGAAGGVGLGGRF